MARQVQVVLQAGDIARLDVDVVALKYPGGLFGAAAFVAKEAGITESQLQRALPSPGRLHLASGQGRLAAAHVAFLSVVPLSSFNYEHVRQFAVDVLRNLRTMAPETRRLGLTLHGIMFGMNLDRSLREEVTGCIAAVKAGDCPALLEQITIVNRDADQVRQLQAVLKQLLPDGLINMPPAPEHRAAARTPSAAEGFDVFISYKSEDATYAQQVFEFLRDHNRRVFFSRESLPHLGSDEYHAQIDLAIERTRHMVLVTSSPDHALAQWVQYEWRLFLGERLAGRKLGNLVTVIAGDMRIQDLPIGLRNREVLSCSPAELFRLLEYTRTDVTADEPLAQPARAPAAFTTISNFILAKAELLRDSSWTAAREHSHALTIEGQTGWRLPTLEELQLIRQRSLLAPEPCYWSAQEAGHGEAFYVHFDDGHVGRGPKSFSKGISAVFVRSAGN